MSARRATRSGALLVAAVAVALVALSGAVLGDRGDPPTTAQRAHDIASSVEHEIRAAVPEARKVQTHLEPLAEVALGEEIAIDETAVAEAVEAETGSPPRELRFVRTDDGIVAFLTLGLGGASSLAEAHGRASAVEERVRRAVPEIADVVVHTEP